MMKLRKLSQFAFIALLGVLACVVSPVSAAESTRDPYTPTPHVQIRHPEWTRDAVIYQLNTRQFTREGTLRAAQAQLPRLAQLGVGIVWLMPIHPIGEKNRKGTLGSPYSVRDYRAVNPELGTLDDLKAFVAEAHRLKLRVILDWVANHTAWDNALVTQHPDWYIRDWKGDFQPTPWWDWSDIIDLDYTKPALRKYMTEAMAYWVREADIDGYRCDVAGFVPLDFWNNVRRELDAVKPGNVFLLAEWEERDLHAHAFDMSYAWSWHEAVRDIVQGKASMDKLFVYYSWNESAWPKDALRMTYTSNHDANAWEATDREAFGDALEAATVLSFVGEGMPLIYSGQEAGNRKRLKFFERDPIEWKSDPMADLYARLIALRHATPALRNGADGATMIHVTNSAPKQVLSFVRRDAQSKVFAVINFSAQPQRVTFEQSLFHGRYRDALDDRAPPAILDAQTTLPLPAWGYKVFSARSDVPQTQSSQRP